MWKPLTSTLMHMPDSSNRAFCNMHFTLHAECQMMVDMCSFRLRHAPFQHWRQMEYGYYHILDEISYGTCFAFTALQDTTGKLFKICSFPEERQPQDRESLQRTLGKEIFISFLYQGIQQKLNVLDMQFLTSLRFMPCTQRYF